jgi:hypothetical protein
VVGTHTHTQTAHRRYVTIHTHTLTHPLTLAHISGMWACLPHHQSCVVDTCRALSALPHRKGVVHHSPVVIHSFMHEGAEPPFKHAPLHSSGGGGDKTGPLQQSRRDNHPCRFANALCRQGYPLMPHSLRRSRIVPATRNRRSFAVRGVAPPSTDGGRPSTTAHPHTAHY